MAELKEYATEVDVDFVRKAVRAIGRCAIKVEVNKFWDSIPSQGGRRLLKTESQSDPRSCLWSRKSKGHQQRLQGAHYTD